MKPQHRFFSEGQGYLGPRDNPITETHCNVWDWDRLRMVKVKGTAKLFPPDEDVEVPILARLADHLSLEVCTISVDDNGLLTGVSTDTEEDDTLFLSYIPLSMVQSLADCRTIQYSKLRELDRLAPGVDLSSYEDEFGVPRKVAFKFNVLNKPLRIQMAWDELNLLKSLPPHPNLVPFDRIVLEDVESRVSCGKKGLLDGRDDVTGVVFTLYELITNDTSFTSIPHWDRDMSMVQSISEWTCNRKLDSEVSKFRTFLNEWVAARRSDGDTERYLNAPNQLTWPDRPTVPDYNVPFATSKTPEGEPIWRTGARYRRTAMENGQYCFCWERPSQSSSRP